MELKDWIRAVRLSLQLSQEKFGETFSVTKGNVSSWENGRHSPSFDQLARMSQMSGMALPGVTNPQNEFITETPSDLLPSSNSKARKSETKYAPHEITYEVIKRVVAGALQGLGIQYEDLVEDEKAAADRITAALGRERVAQTGKKRSFDKLFSLGASDLKVLDEAPAKGKKKPA